MRLVAVETVDFRRSELTNITTLQQAHPRLRALGKNDVVLLRNLGGNQLVFIHGFYLFNVKDMAQARYLRSERLRLLNGSVWDPIKLKDYARQAGIRLENVELYERVVAKLAKAIKKSLERNLKLVA